MSNSPNNNNEIIDVSKMTPVSEQVLADGEMFNLVERIYRDDTGDEKTWNVVELKADLQGDKVISMKLVPILTRTLKYDCVVLVKQFRPHLNKYTLEFPSGVTKSHDDSAAVALQQLTEETGYSCGAVKHISPLIATDPSLSNCTANVVTLEINGDEIRNHLSKPTEEDAKIKELIHVPVHEMQKRLDEFREKGVIIDSTLYAFAIGLAMGSKSVTHIETANPY